jgi:hypothetical protein
MRCLVANLGEQTMHRRDADTGGICAGLYDHLRHRTSIDRGQTS